MPSASSVLLAIHVKRTDNVELKNPILSYIRETYSDREAEDAVDDLVAIQTLRNELVTSQAGSQLTAKDSYIKYYKCLTSIETRFPISNEKGNVRISFPWTDAFRPSKKTSQSNIHYEKAAVLFNVAAVISQQALQVDRATADGIKEACKLFQEAAGMFGHLKESEAAKVDNPRPVDLSPECLSMMEKLMMAQAQECVYHKAVMDKKSPGTLARLAKQAGNMYGEVSAIFNQPVVVQHFERSWVAHTKMKASLYDVNALMDQAKQYNSDTKIAFEIATLSEAFVRMQSVKALAKAVSSEMADSLKSQEEVLTLALTKAQKDNNTVYLERVPAFADVPAVQPAILVKAAPPTNLDASSENLFSGLIPDSSAKALSKYTDMVDSISREQLTALADATDAARITLKQAELPDLLEALDGAELPDLLEALDGVSSASVPEGLLREIEEVGSIGGPQHLQEILTEMGELRRHVEGDLSACQAALDEEAQADAGARAQYGDEWRMPTSATLAKHYWEKLHSYRSTMAQAGESDGKVIQRLRDHEALFAALTPDAAANQLPRLQAPLVSTGADPAVVVASLRRNMEGLSQLSNDRAGLEDRLKELKARDNILPKLMAAGSANTDALFERELKKYDALKADVAANVGRNAELLAAISRDAQAFKAVFEVPAWRAACEGAAGGIKTTLKTYKEVLDHLSEGLRFYMSLQEAVKQHQQQCSDYAYTRALQRDDMRQDLDRRRREAPAYMSYGGAPPPANPPYQQQQPYGGQQQQQPAYGKAAGASACRTFSAGEAAADGAAQRNKIGWFTSSCSWAP
ncbi:hypothetical protein OEZ85_001828 [Tetradesmus obliquus]|uniref:BRO1 domain-containing protein n=1 Tax=Tetradesmus obliquus TaxID=3088 RepID=A0ABY8U1P3_TETOB|nr:hypothetical protein OEZ85_001828 [Tetradesmus obliquus]